MYEANKDCLLQQNHEQQYRSAAAESKNIALMFISLKNAHTST